MCFNYTGYLWQPSLRITLSFCCFHFSCHDIAFLQNLLPVLLSRRLTPEKLSPMYFFTCIDRLDNAELKSKKFPRIAPAFVCIRRRSKSLITQVQKLRDDAKGHHEENIAQQAKFCTRLPRAVVFVYIQVMGFSKLQNAKDKQHDVFT